MSDETLRDRALKSSGAQEWADIPSVTSHEISLTDSVRAAVRDYVEGPEDDSESDRHRYRRGVVHASEKGCIRKRWYGTRDIVERESDSFPAGIGHRGNLVEDEVEEALSLRLAENLIDDMSDDALESLGELTVHNEMALYKKIELGDIEFYITGNTDPYVRDRDGNVVEIIEVKSVGTGRIPSEPKPSHVWQLNVYLSIIGLDSGTITYVDSSNWDHVKTFRVEQSPELWAVTLTQHTIFNQYVRDDELPPPLPMFEDECRWCQYRGLCVRDDPGDEWQKSEWPPRPETDKENIHDQMLQ